MRKLSSPVLRVLTLLLLLLLGVLLGEGLAQSAWTRQKHSGYVRIGAATLSTSEFYTPLGDKVSSASYQGLDLNFYGEYGITNDVTAIVDFPFFRQQSLETTGTQRSLADTTVGFKYRFLKGKTPLAVAVDFGLPTGDKNGFVPFREIPGDVFRLPSGDGEFNTRLSLYASRSMKDGNAFLSGGGGYNFRTQEFTDEVSYFVQGGYRFLPKFWLSGAVQGLLPARTPNLERSVGFGVGEGVEYTRVGGDLLYLVSTRYRLSAGYFKPLRGKNILAGDTLIFGIALEF